MAHRIDTWENVHDLVAQVFMIDRETAREAWNMVDKVVRICLLKHAGADHEEDVLRVKKRLLARMREELDDPSYYHQVEKCSVQTCIVVMAREMTLNYVRTAKYAHSTLSDIFRAMNVDVSGAEDYLDGLDSLFSPSQKCVLRLLYGEGCTVMQAAGMLGVTPNEVQTLQWQAMERLQQEWMALKNAGDVQ